MYDIRYSPTQVTFAMPHTVMMRLDAKTFAQVARCRAQSHTARVFLVFLVTEENPLAQGSRNLEKKNMPRNRTAFWAGISFPTR